MRALAAALLALACAGAPEHPLPAPAQPEAAQGVWLEPGEFGYEEQGRWGVELPAGFNIVVLPADLFLANCEAVAEEPCSDSTLGFTELAHARVVLRFDDPNMRRTLLHEMGHVIRGEGGHLQAPGNVMSSQTNDTAWPTHEDFAFVLRW